MVRENMVGTAVRVSKSVLKRLERAAYRRGCQKGLIHREALELYLTILESGRFVTRYQPSEAYVFDDSPPELDDDEGGEGAEGPPGEEE